MMIGDIDLSLKVLNPILHVALPNRKVVGRLKEAKDIKHDVLLGKINELSFTIPYEIDDKFELIKNPNIDKIKERYLIKFQIGSSTEWYMINEINDDADDSKSDKTIHAYSLAWELADKLIRGLEETSINATTILNTALYDTIWDIGYVDSEFDFKYRSFEASEKTVLDFVFEIAETFNAIVEFDTLNRLINLKKEENIGVNKGLQLSYGKYLKSLSKQSNADEMVTRFHVFGSENLSIQRLNPTGATYLENFSYFMFPFEQDMNGNVLNSSDYMSDELCKAIIDYDELVVSKQSEFTSLLVQIETNQTLLTAKQVELDTLNNELSIVQDNHDIQKSTGDLTIHNFVYNGTLTTKTATLKNTKKYVAMIKVSSITNLTIKLDGVTKTVAENTWTVLGKLASLTSTNIETSGTGTNIQIDIYVLEILESEYTATNNESALVNKYNDKNKQSQVDSKQIEINSVNATLTNLNTSIINLRTSISIEANFTPELIIERNHFIIEKTWQDDNFIDDEDLYEEAIKRFEDLKKPKTTFNIDIVNFLSIVEEQRNWDKLSIGDTVIIRYGLLDVLITAKIIEIHYDYESDNISLTISSTSDISDEGDKLANKLYDAYSTSTSLDMSKYKWNGASTKVTEIDEIINNTWDATKRKIQAGVNNSISFSGRGITITDPTNPNNVLVIQSGVLAISNDNTATWKHAITANGIVGERIFGKILAGVNLSIENESGKFTFDENGATIQGSSFNLIGGQNGVSIDSYNGLTITKNDNTVKTTLNATSGFKIQTSSDNGVNWNDKFLIDQNSILTAKGLVIQSEDGTSVMIDAKNKTIDFSKFTTIAGVINASNLNLNNLNVGNGNLIIDTNGNVTLKGVLDGATGSFSGDVTAKKMIVEGDGYKSFYFQLDLNGTTSTGWAVFKSIYYSELSGSSLIIARTPTLVSPSINSLVKLDFYAVDAYFNNRLTVASTFSSSSITSSGNITASGNITGSSMTTSTLTLNGSGTVSSSLSVTGTLSTSSKAYLNSFVEIGNNLDVNGDARPLYDNSYSSGASSRRWTTVYASTSTINTSDRNHKDYIENIPDIVLDAWSEVRYTRFKFKDAITLKGYENARWHTGVIAQEIEQAFINHGLNAFDYGLLCYDSWEDEYGENEQGEMVLKTPAGNIYSIRPEECLMLESALMRREVNILKGGI